MRCLICPQSSLRSPKPSLSLASRCHRTSFQHCRTFLHPAMQLRSPCRRPLCLPVRRPPGHRSLLKSFPACPDSQLASSNLGLTPSLSIISACLAPPVMFILSTCARQKALSWFDVGWQCPTVWAFGSPHRAGLPAEQERLKGFRGPLLSDRTSFRTGCRSWTDRPFSGSPWRTSFMTVCPT